MDTIDKDTRIMGLELQGIVAGILAAVIVVALL
jgi:hypothetical protein